MRVELRPFEEPDLARLAGWTSRVAADAYMSRVRPRDESLSGHAPHAGLLWYVIRAGGEDVGTVWVEPEPDPARATLGILLGDPALFGHGIGGQAIGLVIARMRVESPHVRTLALHVRRDNARAIACYERSGFAIAGSGTKVLPGGIALEFLCMELTFPPRPAATLPPLPPGPSSGA